MLPHLARSPLDLGHAEALERKFAACFLGFVVFLQILNAVGTYIERSKGRCGRLLYYIAFAQTILHDIFVGVVVPSALIWVAYQLYLGDLEIEPLITTVVGALWYGPDRVQHSIANILHLKKRLDILRTALAAHHRSREEFDSRKGTWTTVCYQCRLPLLSFALVEERITSSGTSRLGLGLGLGLRRSKSKDDSTQPGASSNSNTRRQSSMGDYPQATGTFRNSLSGSMVTESYTNNDTRAINGRNMVPVMHPNLIRLPTPVISPSLDLEGMSREISSIQHQYNQNHSSNNFENEDNNSNGENVRMRHDRDLRSIARKGVRMAFSGFFDENDIRDWYVLIVADQARFPSSPLDNALPADVSIHELSGYGAARFKRSVQEVQIGWTDEEWRKLITVYQEIRTKGLPYLRREGWVL